MVYIMSKIDIGKLSTIHDGLEYNAKTLLGELTSDGVNVETFVLVCDAMKRQIESIFDLYSPYIKGRYRKGDSDSFRQGTPRYVKNNYTRLYPIAETLSYWSTMNDLLVANPEREDIINLLTELISAVEYCKENVVDYLCW